MDEGKVVGVGFDEDGMAAMFEGDLAGGAAAAEGIEDDGGGEARGEGAGAGGFPADGFLFVGVFLAFRSRGLSQLCETIGSCSFFVQ